MLSSDKNVENIAQLIGVLRHYLGLQAEYVKLDLIDKVVRLLTAAALTILLLLIGVAVMMFFSFAVAHWLATYIGYALAFLVVSLFHLLLLILFITYRKPWIERPLVRFLANLFLSK